MYIICLLGSSNNVKYIIHVSQFQQRNVSLVGPAVAFHTFLITRPFFSLLLVSYQNIFCAKCCKLRHNAL